MNETFTLLVLQRSKASAMFDELEISFQKVLN